jgi:murein peptide amidase A
VVIGHSVRGRAIRAVELRAGDARRTVLVVGCIHGNEPAGMDVVALLRRRPIPGVDLWLVPVLNPDGLAAGTRANADGVDLNRNFPSLWQRLGRRGTEWSGPRPLSEPETRAARSLILRVRPALTIWFHQPQAIVRAWGPSSAAARRFAGLAGMPFRSLRWPPGAATSWQNHRFPDAASFVVELAAGPLAHARTLALARAIRLDAGAARLARG